MLGSLAEEFDDLIRGVLEHASAEAGIQADPECTHHDLIGNVQRTADAMLAVAEVRLTRKISAEQQSCADLMTIEKMRQLRMTYEELTEAYDAMRRMVERGYLTYTPAAST